MEKSNIENTEKDWTIMIYMAGDNNLSTDMAYALEQIKSVASQNKNINLFVYYDGASNDVPTLYCDFTETEKDAINYYRSFKIEKKLIERVGTSAFNENSASVNNIINFVDWCVNRVEYKVGAETYYGRKARKYAMIFSGHSFGFQNEGLFKDEKADYYLTLSKLRWMFERITYTKDQLEELAKDDQWVADEKWNDAKFKERTKVILGQPLSILGFDSCVMSMLEIGCQFRKVAETLVASEGSIPNAGWSYAQMLVDKIAESEKPDYDKPSKPKKNLTAIDIAANFVENFIKQQNKFALADISADMSAWDLTKLSRLEDAVYDLVAALLKCFDDRYSIAYQQMKRILIQAHWQCQTYMFDQNIDLGDFCQLLSEEIESLREEFKALDRAVFKSELSPVFRVRALCKTVLERLRDCIIICGYSGGAYQYSNGVSLFFPWSWASYAVSRKNYESLSFVQLNKTGDKWNEFLQKYLSEVSVRRAKPLSKITEDGTFEKDENGAVVFNSYFYMDELEAEKAATAASRGIDKDDFETSAAINGSSSAAANGTTKNPSNLSQRLAVNGSDRLAVNGSDRLAVNGSDRLAVNGSDRLAVNGSDRLAVNGSDRLPVNGSDKLFNALSLLFSEFMITKNIESYWNYAGFISKDANFVIEKKKNSIESKQEEPAPEMQAQGKQPWIIGVPGNQVFSHRFSSPVPALTRSVSGTGIKHNKNDEILDMIRKFQQSGDANVSELLKHIENHLTPSTENTDIEPEDSDAPNEPVKN